MNGKLIISVFAAIIVLGPAAMYYLQVYAYYEEIAPTGPQDVQMVTLAGNVPEPVPHDAFQAIDANSSPIRYRACFTTSLGLEEARARYVQTPEAEVRLAPGWFDCFDAAAIGAELAAGTATTFLSEKNIAYSVDRVVAITADGRGYIWHTLNNCGAKDYDGTVVGEECPPPPRDDN